MTNKMKKVLLGMSGGVDSSAAALVLQRAGYAVAGVTLSLQGEKTRRSDAVPVSYTHLLCLNNK